MSDPIYLDFADTFFFHYVHDALYPDLPTSFDDESPPPMNRVARFRGEEVNRYRE